MWHVTMVEIDHYKKVATFSCTYTTLMNIFQKISRISYQSPLAFFEKKFF